MKWAVIMAVGLLIAVGTPIIDIYYALQGIWLPNSLMFSITLIGIVILALGGIFGIENIQKPCKSKNGDR